MHFIACTWYIYLLVVVICSNLMVVFLETLHILVFFRFSIVFILNAQQRWRMLQTTIVSPAQGALSQGGVLTPPVKTPASTSPTVQRLTQILSTPLMRPPKLIDKTATAPMSQKTSGRTIEVPINGECNLLWFFFSMELKKFTFTSKWYFFSVVSYVVVMIWPWLLYVFTLHYRYIICFFYFFVFKKRMFLIFSSSERKAQMCFSDQHLSVVRRCQCHKLFTFSSSSLEPLDQFQPNLAQSILGWRELKFVQMKSPDLLQGEVITIYWKYIDKI